MSRRYIKYPITTSLVFYYLWDESESERRSFRSKILVIPVRLKIFEGLQSDITSFHRWSLNHFDNQKRPPKREEESWRNVKLNIKCSFCYKCNFLSLFHTAFKFSSFRETSESFYMVKNELIIKLRKKNLFSKL